MLQGVRELESQPRLAADCETYTLPKWNHRVAKGRQGSALDPHTGRVSILGAQGDTGRPVIFDILALEAQGCDLTPLRDLLVSREYVVGMNFKFDIKFLRQHLGIFLENGRCILSLAKLISNATGSKAGLARGHSLEDLSRDYLNVFITGKGKEQITSWFPRPLSTGKIQYMLGDIRHLLPLHDLFMRVLCDPLPTVRTIGTSQRHGFGMKRVVDLEMEFLVCTAEMEFNGLPASAEVFADIQAATIARVEELAVKLCHAFDLETAPADLWEDGEVATERSRKWLNNPQKLLELIKKAVGLQRLTDVQAAKLQRMLELIEDLSKSGDVEFISDDEADMFSELKELEHSILLQTSQLMQDVLEYKRLQKQKGMDLGKFINPVTGRIHGNLAPVGAATGRTSSANPNMQNVSARTKLIIERPLDALFPSSANPNFDLWHLDSYRGSQSESN